MGWLSHRGQGSFVAVGNGDKAGRTTLVPYVLDSMLVESELEVVIVSLSKPADF